MGTAEDTHPPVSDLDASPPSASSLNSTETHVQAGAQTPSQLDVNDPLSLYISNYLKQAQLSQEDMSTHHTTPLTPLPTQDQDTKPSATPPATPPSSVYNSSGSESQSSSGSPKPLKRAGRAISSKIVASALEKFYNQTKVAKHAYCRLSRIFEKTRTKMLHKSYNLFVIASRGFERGKLPTRRTRPSLHKRRYSIDVNTPKGWGTNSASEWREGDIEEELCEPEISHLDPLPSLSHTEPMPFPSRYAAFGAPFQMNVPFDTNVYLSLGDVTIHNDAFRSIGCTNWDNGGDPWMRDESLDMALETLSRDFDCDENRIAIANSMVSQICLFAVNSDDSSPQEYAEYKARFWDKRWIFIVVNDATGRANTYSLQGNHWSLVLLDRIRRETYYFDSLFIRDYSSQNMGREISRGMLKILGEDANMWRYLPQFNTPHQTIDNRFRGDTGACGPFVYKMTELLIRHIRTAQLQGEEELCSLELYDGFHWYFRDRFHSRDVRHDIQKRIARWRAVVNAPSIANVHDWDAIRGTNVELDESPVIQFDVPRRSETPTQQDVQHGSAYSPYDGLYHDGSVGANEHYPTDAENENYVLHGNDSDSTTVDVSLTSESEEEDLLTDAGEESDHEDGGVDIVNGEEVEEESVSGELREITDSLGQYDEESVTEDEDDNLT